PYEALMHMLRSGPFPMMEPMMFLPDIEVKETNDAYVLKADLPGVEEDDVEIALSGNLLTISGERSQEEVQENERFHAHERAYGRFSRSFTLPDTADVNAVRAELKNGVLEIVAPKKAEVQPRRIPLGEQPQTTEPKQKAA